MSDSNCKACEEQTSQNNLSKEQINTFAKNDDLTGTLSASFALAVEPNTANKIGGKMGVQSSSNLMKLIETPGSNKQKRSMSDSQKKKHLINSVGLGNFGLNSTFESGLISSVAGGRKNSSDFLKQSNVGSSLIAASALGIDVPKGDLLGIGPNDSPMFKIFKLAGFGLRLLCADLKGKQRGGPGGYTSDTEESLGLILSLGINLDLIARLKSIFDKLLNLKPNFSNFGIQDLNIADSLFNLCDWIENMEYGSDTIDTFRKNFGNMTNKNLTEVVGKNLVNEGTYDSFAKNDFGFDQQFKSIVGDVDKLKCDACKLGQTELSLVSDNKKIANVEFDPRTGLQREKGDTVGSDTLNPSEIKTQIGIDIDSENKSIEYVEDVNIQFADKLTKPASAGDKTLSVSDSKKFPIGSHMKLAEGTDREECIQCIQHGSIELNSPLMYSHETGTTVSNPYPTSPCENEAKKALGKSEIKNKIKVEEPVFKQKSVTTQLNEIDKKITSSDDSNNKINKLPTIKSELGIAEKTTNTDGDIKSSLTTLNKTQSQKNLLKSEKTDAYNLSELKKYISKDAVSSHTIVEKTSVSSISYETESTSIVYDTYTDIDGSIKQDTYEKKSKTQTYVKTKSEVKIKKTFKGDVVDSDAEEVTSFHTGEVIYKKELEGTILEDADMNAVSLLHPTDLKNLKNKNEVDKIISDAEQVFDNYFEKEIEKTINLVLSEQSDGIIFGAQLPILNGNQIVINSERIIISAKTQECGIFSKRKFFVSTDDEITMNAKQRIVMKTDMHTSIESPTIHLGNYTTRNHPSLKGDCTVWWLQDLCDWLSTHTHYDPYVTTSVPVQQGTLAALRARAPTLLSERIFISG